MNNEIAFKDNRFFIEGEGNIKYSYNNGRLANDPKLACMNFINALDKIPVLLDKYQADNESLKKNIPVYLSIIDKPFTKEDQLNTLKAELDTLNRKIEKDLNGSKQNQKPAEAIVECLSLL